MKNFSQRTKNLIFSKNESVYYFYIIFTIYSARLFKYKQLSTYKGQFNFQFITKHTLTQDKKVFNYITRLILYIKNKT